MANKAVFLDRDDTIIVDPGYISDPEQVKLVAGAAEALKKLYELGYKLVIVTNQSGIARGKLTEKTLEKIHQRLTNLLARDGAFLDGIYYSPYHVDGIIEKYTRESDCRKPGAGMLLKAAKDLNIDMAQSWMVGDKDSDVGAGINAGCKTIRVQRPVSPSRAKIKYVRDNADYVATNIKEAVNIIKRCRYEKTEEVAELKKLNELKEHKEFNELKEPKESQERKELKMTEDAVRVEDAKLAAELSGVIEIQSDKEAVVMDDKCQVKEKAVVEVAGGSNDDRKEIHRTLKEIHQVLSSMHRVGLFNDFTILRKVAKGLQVIVGAILLMAVWFVFDSSSENDAFIYINLSFATVLQLIVMTIFIVTGKR